MAVVQRIYSVLRAGIFRRFSSSSWYPDGFIYEFSETEIESVSYRY